MTRCGARKGGNPHPSRCRSGQRPLPTRGRKSRRAALTVAGCASTFKRARLKRSLLAGAQETEVISAGIKLALAAEIGGARACRAEVGDGIEPRPALAFWDMKPHETQERRAS